MFTGEPVNVAFRMTVIHLVAVREMSEVRITWIYAIYLIFLNMLVDFLDCFCGFIFHYRFTVSVMCFHFTDLIKYRCRCKLM